MSTPEKPRPSLDDTLHRIDQLLAGPCLRCARQALPGEQHCAAHKRIPREMIEELGPVEPVVRDGNTFTVTQPGVYQLSGSVWPFGPPPAVEPPPDTSWLAFEKPNARATEPGGSWLERLRRRLRP